MSSYMKFETALFIRAIMSGVIMCAAYRIFWRPVISLFRKTRNKVCDGYFVLAGSGISPVFSVVPVELRGTSTVFIARCTNWCFFCKLFVKFVAISGKKM